VVAHDTADLGVAVQRVRYIITTGAGAVTAVGTMTYDDVSAANALAALRAAAPGGTTVRSVPDAQDHPAIGTSPALVGLVPL